MSTLPAVADEEEAADLVRELFRSPGEAAVALATPDDRSSHDAVLRYLRVAFADLPSGQVSLLRRGGARLLADPELSGHLVCIVGEGDDPAACDVVATQAASAVAAGDLRGLPVHGTNDGDLHALLLDLCAVLGASIPASALARDAADLRYRDLALSLAAVIEVESATSVLGGAAACMDPSDEYDVEALGRAFERVLMRQGEQGVVQIIAGAPAVARRALRAGLQEALSPARLQLLTDAQQNSTRAALARRAAEEPENAYLALRLDADRQASLLQTLDERLRA